MPTLVIRDVSEDVVRALDVRASLAGQSRETWIRDYLGQVAHLPEIKDRYRLQVSRRVRVTDGGGLVVMGPKDEEGYILHETSGYIERDATADEGARFFIYNPLPEEYEAFKQAVEYVRRNGVGDRERAITTLGRCFDVVIEMPPMTPVAREESRMTRQEAIALETAIRAELVGILPNWVVQGIDQIPTADRGSSAEPAKFRVRLLTPLRMPYDIKSAEDWAQFKREHKQR